MQTIATGVLEHDHWRIRLGRSWRGLCYASLDGAVEGLECHVRRHFDDAVVLEDPAAVADDADRLAAYLDGRKRDLELELDLRGTPFQVAVWRALLRIPYGATATYGEIARAVGVPLGAHAVGQAVRVNPVAIVVPCHRVVASGGRIGGYGGDVDTKRRLLALEGAEPLAD